MNPEFSLIIPTYNRIDALRSCFEYLEKLHYPKNEYEVVLVDDGSQDATKDLTGNEADIPLRVIHQKNGGAAAARNTGILASRGRFCLFVDDDVMVHPDLLLEHHAAHLAQPRYLVRGPVINIPALPAPASTPALWKHFSMNYLCTSNASLSKEFLLEAGLFDVTFPRWEDAELAVRLKRIGVVRKFVLNAIVYHLKPPEPLEALIRTAQKDGMSAAALYQRYPSFRMRLRSGIHPLNTIRNFLLTKGPLRSKIEQSAQGKGPFPKSMAESLLIEKAYLEAGLEQLRKK
ncbi:MAG: glycosyltransferase [bacterium]|nr:glycosyltransferase [bacterium]